MAKGTICLLLSAVACMAQPPEIQRLSIEDRQRMMDLLHITSLRMGPTSRPESQPGRSGLVNYDESKANPYPTLPDPLVLKNGKKVTSAKMWWEQRRPEIVEDFDREVYGRMPKVTPRVKWEVISSTRETNGDVAIVTKQLVGHVDNASFPQVTVDMQLTLSTPANASGPVPVIMEFGGGFRFPPGRGPAPPPGPTWQQQVLARGWGYAQLVPASIQADNGAGLTQGIIGLVNKGQPRKVDDWGALRAWGWGASRALDYFQTDRAVDAKRVGLEGHSRFGKAALVAMAYDDRFAIVYVSSSGEGGAKLHRRNWGEQVENVAAPNEYHWMAPNFLKYAGPLHVNDLPVDSHELVALCAPRPVFLSAGATEGDGWVDAKGTFLAGVGAGPVYRLLGKKDLGTTEFPPIETGLMDGDISFRQHSGGHTPAPNWPTFLAFAARYFGHASPETTSAARWTPPRTPDGQPDLEGTWTNATITPFERPKEFEGKPILTEQEAAELEKRAAENRVDRAPRDGEVGDYNRLWIDSGTKVVPTRQSSLVVDPPDGRVPLSSAGETKRNYNLAHNADSFHYMSPWDQCITRGLPGGMFPAGYNNAYQIVQTPGYVLIVSEMIHESRIIPLDSRQHLQPSIRQWNGDSIGHWEGNTLVVDTTNYNGKGWMTTSAASGRIKGVPQSDALHVVERFARVDPGTISYEVTIDDPNVYTQPWRVSAPLTRDDNYQIYEYACHEGNEAVGLVLRGGRARDKAAGR